MVETHRVGSLTIARAAAASAERIDLACAADADDVGAPFTRLLRYDRGAWTAVDIEDDAQSLCQWQDNAGKTSLLMMSREGHLIDVDGGGAATKVEDAALRGGRYELGFLNELRQVGGHLYAAGWGGQAYRRETDGAWHALSQPILDGPRPDADWILEYLKNPERLQNPEANLQFGERVRSASPKIFWSLAGSSDDSVYFCGERHHQGLLYLWNGARLLPCDVPTGKSLRDVQVTPDGTVWICGREGLLLRGRDGHFEVLLDLGPRPRFASLAWFRDRLYIGASPGAVAVYAFDGRTAHPVETGLAPELTDAHVLQAIGDVLWAVGTKSVARFDGRAWEPIPVPGVNDERG